MMRPLAVLFALAAALHAQPNTTIAELIAKIHALRKATDFRATGRLVRVAGSGQRHSYQVSLKGKSFGETVKLFCEVKDPAPARVRLLLDTHSTGKASIRVGHAGDRAPKDLSFENWADPLLDSDLSYEDLMESHFLWKRQALVEEAKYGARDCYVVRSEPGAGDRSHYSAVTSWLDQSIYYPVKVEKVLRTSRMVKEFIYYGLRQSKGMWSASQVEVRIKDKPGSTLLVITRGSGKADLSASEFDPAVLTRP